MSRLRSVAAALAPSRARADTACAVDTGSEAVLRLDPITAIARHLDLARNGIQTQTRASTCRIDDQAIAPAPGGANNLLNQVTPQAPSASQDSFGQFHVRGEHNGLQYRLSGIILPEGIGAFGQSLDPGGNAALYGGRHGTVQPSIDYGGSAGRMNYFVSGDLCRAISAPNRPTAARIRCMITRGRYMGSPMSTT